MFVHMLFAFLSFSTVSGWRINNTDMLFDKIDEPPEQLSKADSNWGFEYIKGLNCGQLEIDRNRKGIEETNRN